MADKNPSFAPWLDGLYDWYDSSAFNQWGRRMVDAAYPYMDRPLGEQVTGGLQALGQMGTQAANTAASGLGALATLPYAGVDKTVAALDARTNPENPNYNPLIPTYQAGSPAGQDAVNLMGAVAEPVAAAGPALGNLAFEATGSPGFATAAHVAPDAALMALGLRRPKRAPQTTFDDLFPDPRALPGPEAPGPDLFSREGVTGRPWARDQEGAIRIVGRDAEGNEIYEKAAQRVNPIVDVFRAPKIDVEGNILPDQPTPPGVAESPLFTSAVPEAMKRTKLQEATPQEWLAELKKMGVDERELGLTGVKGALDSAPADKPVSRKDVVDAYNAKDKNIQMWRVGNMVKDPWTDEMEQEYLQAEEASKAEEARVKQAVATAYGGEGTNALSGAVATIRNGLDIDDARPDWATDPEWADITASAKELVAAREALDPYRLRKERLMKHVAGKNTGRQGEDAYRPFEYANAWTSGGDTGNMNLSLTQFPRGENSVFRKGDKPWPDLHRDHYAGTANKPDWMNAVHSRTTQKPVLSVPSYFDEQGQEWRPTTIHGDEPWQPDAFKRLRMPGEPGYNPTDEYSGFAKEMTPAREAELASIKTDLKDVMSEISGLQNSRRSASDIYYNWPSSMDTLLRLWARQLGDEDYEDLSPANNDTRARMLAALEAGQQPPNADQIRSWPDYEEDVRAFLDKMVNGETEPDPNETSRLRDLNARKKELENRAKELADNKLIGEYMPFAPKKEGLYERAMAGIMNQLAMAIENGDDYISLPSMRSHALSYYYTNVGPDAETLFRWGPESVEREVYYDSKEERFYRDSGGGNIEPISADTIPRDIQQQAKSSATDYGEWLNDAEVKYLDWKVNDLTNNRNPSRARMYKTTDDLTHSNFDQAIEHQTQLNVRALRDAGQFPERYDFDEISEYRRAIAPHRARAERAAAEAVQQADGYAIDDYRYDGRVFDTPEDAIEEAERYAQRQLDSTYDVVGLVQSADGVDRWEDIMSGTPRVRIPRSADIPPNDEPMLPIQDVPIEEYTGKPAGGPTNTGIRADDLRGNAKPTYIVGQMYYKDAIITKQIKAFLRNVLGLNENQIGDVFGDIEHATGKSSSSSHHAPWQLFGQPRMRSRAIKITPELIEAYNKRGPGGMFATPAIKPEKPKPKKAERPNPGKIQKAYAAGKLTRDEAIAKLREAGVPDKAIKNMIR